MPASRPPRHHASVIAHRQGVLDGLVMLGDFGQQHACGGSRLAASIAGHLQFEIADHLEVLAIPGRKREPFFESSRGDQGIKGLQSM
jgi:hypothetical protein